MIYIIQNHPDVPAGIYGDLLKTARIPFQTIRADRGVPLPAATSATAVIVLGGYMGVNDVEQFPSLRGVKNFVRDCVSANTPFFGICLGGQLLAETLGGKVTDKHCDEKGLCALTLTGAGQSDPLFTGVPASFSAFQWHNDSFSLPPAATLLASSTACPGQAFRFGRAWGVQFHPEVDLAIVQDWTKESGWSLDYQQDFSRREIELRSFGTRLLSNFLEMAGC